MGVTNVNFNTSISPKYVQFRPMISREIIHIQRNRTDSLISYMFNFPSPDWMKLDVFKVNRHMPISGEHVRFLKYVQFPVI